MNANQVLQVAKSLGIKGQFVKSFRNGQELREYTVPRAPGVMYSAKIRALPSEHA